MLEKIETTVGQLVCALACLYGAAHFLAWSEKGFDVIKIVR